MGQAPLSGVNLSVQMERLFDAGTAKPWEIDYMTKAEMADQARECQEEADKLQKISRMLRGNNINPEAVPALLVASNELLESLMMNGTRNEFTNTAVAASKLELALAGIKPAKAK